jgi:hypothetical protein
MRQKEQKGRSAISIRGVTVVRFGGHNQSQLSTTKSLMSRDSCALSASGHADGLQTPLEATFVTIPVAATASSDGDWLGSANRLKSLLRNATLEHKIFQKALSCSTGEYANEIRIRANFEQRCPTHCSASNIQSSV